MDFKILKKIIDENKSFLLTTHVNPDADAIGSEIALYHILKRLGKEVLIINHSVTPYNLTFLDIDNIIRKFNLESDKNFIDDADVLVALDFNRANRLVSMEESFVQSDKIKVCIDHHQDAEKIFNYYFNSDEYAATGQILYDFIKQTKIVDLDYKLAYPIYTAIMTDTGSFRFDRTTPQLHRITAELLECGFDPEDVYDKVYDQSKISKVRLLGKTLDTLKLAGDNKIGYMLITQDTFNELNAIESDTEGFVNYTLSIDNIVLGILFIELKNGFKVSFRSKGALPVNQLAAQFGGGGHTNAAGARFLKSKMNDEMQNIILESEKFLNNYNQDKNV
ncbi:MAG: bifunctional oligoribonuclease/PAP phosphatase NrnA [Ignavibacterium sp.]|nr:MAG: bifunctional oligoribonuclease/PAP phosphatase NrnA [Ignavibacterium sp.]